MIITNVAFSDLKSIADMTKENFIDSWSLSMLESSFNSDGFFGFKISDETGVLSVAVFGGVLEERELYFIVTRSDARKKGYAKDLLNHAFTVLKNAGVEKIFLEVREGNKGAINLYTETGFVKISERKNYYGTETAVIMQKEL